MGVLKRICLTAVEYKIFATKWNQVMSTKSNIVTSDFNVTKRLSKQLHKLGCHYGPESIAKDLGVPYTAGMPLPKG